MPEFDLRAIQGQATSQTLTLTSATFRGTEGLAASVGAGDGQAAVLSLTPTWTAGQTTGSYSQVDVSLSAAQTLALPWGVYNVQVGFSDGSAAQAYGWLTIYPGPGGTATPFWRSLASPALAMAYIPKLAQDKQDNLPHALAAATRTIEGYCGRPLVLDSYDHWARPSDSGRLRLRARPVVELTRVETGRIAAVTVSNTAADLATVNAVPTGPNAMTLKTLVFASSLSGATTSQSLTVASYATIGALTTAINALGNGWSAIADVFSAAFPTSALFGAAGARDARFGRPEFHTGGGSWSYDNYRLDPDAGTISGTYSGPVRVAYRAGYAYLKADSDLGYYPVPEDLAAACCMTANSILESAPLTGPIIQQQAAGRMYTTDSNASVLPTEARIILEKYAEEVF